MNTSWYSVPLNVPETAFDKIPVAIDSDDPLCNVGKKELASALLMAYEDGSAADWLFKNSASSFHVTPSTLSPESFDNALAIHLHDEISTADTCPSRQRGMPFIPTAYVYPATAESLQHMIVSKDLYLLLIPVAKLGDLSVGYVFIRGFGLTTLQKSVRASSFGEEIKNYGDGKKPYLISGRFCFHHRKHDLLTVMNGMAGQMVGIVSYRSISKTERERSFFTVPKGDYGANEMPSRVLSSQCNIDYKLDCEVPQPQSEPGSTSADVSPSASVAQRKSGAVNERTSVAQNDLSASSPTEAHVISSTQSSVSVGLGGIGTVLTPTSSQSILPDLETTDEYMSNYINTQLYDEDVSERSEAVNGRQTHALSPHAHLDEVLNSSLPMSSDSHSILTPVSNELSTSGEQSQLEFGSAYPEGNDIMVVDDADENAEASIRLPSLAIDLANAGQTQPTGRPRTDLSWLVSSHGGTPDGVGVPRCPGGNDTSSGMFDMASLRKSLLGIEQALMGTFYAPTLKKDVMHPLTGELLSRWTGQLNGSLNVPDGNTVQILRRIARQSYYATSLPVSTDTRLIMQPNNLPLQCASTFRTPADDHTSLQAMPIGKTQHSQEAKRLDQQPTQTTTPYPRATPLRPEAAAAPVAYRRVVPAPLAPRPVSGVAIAPRAPVNRSGQSPAKDPSGATNTAAVPIQPAAPVLKDTTRESKLEAKRIKNRLSAAKSNQKRREQLEAQKKELALLRQRVEELKSKKQLVSAENESLRALREKLSADSTTQLKG